MMSPRAVAVEVGVVDGVGAHIVVVVGGAAFDGVDLEEATQRWQVLAGAHFDGGDGAGVFVAAWWDPSQPLSYWPVVA